MEPRTRYSFVKDGVASNWFELSEDQAQAAARKEFGCSIPFWRTLKTKGVIKKNAQIFNDDLKNWRFICTMRPVTI